MARYDIDAEIKKLLDSLKDCEEHQFVADAERAIYSAQGYLSRLVELNRNDEMDDLISINLDLLGEMVSRAVRREEDDRVNAGWNRASAAADLHRGA